MFDKFKEAKDQIKMLKELQSTFKNVDMSNPQSIIDSLGLDMEELNKHFELMSENQAMEKLKVDLRFVNKSNNENPNYAYESDSGFDLRSSEEVIIQPNSRALIPTGVRFDIGDSYEIQIRSKSGLALNQGLFVLNSPGTIDSGYQGEVKVILFNTTDKIVKIEKGQKVAQAVLCPVLTGKWVNLIQVSDIKNKDRNDNGFGSTGI